MCIYVQSPLTEPAQYLVFPTPENSREIVATTDIRNGGSAAFWELPYNQGPVANDDYALDVAHASDKITGYDATRTTHEDIYMDQIFSVGANTSSFSKALESPGMYKEHMKEKVFGETTGHMFGYATCHWLKSCSGTDKVGTRCNATLSNVVYEGYCFHSDMGTLECGHATALDNEYGQKPVLMDGNPNSPNKLASEAGLVPISSVTPLVVASTPGATQTVYRCPTGSPAKTRGSYVSKRLLIAGCMKPGDASYDPIADVHVPAYCAVPSDYKPGCLIPWATNFDPSAKQSAKCTFATKGCTSPTAVNYNSEATYDDPDAPCIEGIRGCTIKAATYYGVQSDTPAYKSGFHGDSARFFGRVEETEYNGPAVVNADLNANVLEGCVVAIEGCLDSAAANYDPQATQNTATWCVPAKTGCMMPLGSIVGGDYRDPRVDVLGEGNNGLDTTSGTWDIAVSVHDRTMCRAGRYGCPMQTKQFNDAFGPYDKKAVNYEEHSTYVGTCYFDNVGCLNPAAKNFGCFDRNADTPCKDTLVGENAITVHVPGLCSWPPAPPAPPRPPPPADATHPNSKVEITTTLTVVATGTVQDYTPAVKQALEVAFVAAITPNLPEEASAPNVTLTVTAASVNLNFNVKTYSGADAGGITTAMETTFSDTASVQNSLGSAAGVTILSPPVIVNTYVVLEDGRPTGLSAGAIAGIVIGVLIGVALLVGGAWYYKKKKNMNKPVYPA